MYYYKKCGYCGKPFKTKKSNKVYCSVYCVNRASELRGKLKREGKIISVREGKLRNDDIEKLLKKRYSSYKISAKKRHHPFDFSFDDFRKYTKRNCYYCGEKANPLNGMDRVNSSIGYTKYNVVPCCIVCNRMKLNLGEKDFAEHILKLSKSKWVKKFKK